jgi:hypothetical protein
MRMSMMRTATTAMLRLSLAERIHGGEIAIAQGIPGDEIGLAASNGILIIKDTTLFSNTDFLGRH